MSIAAVRQKLAAPVVIRVGHRVILLRAQHQCYAEYIRRDFDYYFGAVDSARVGEDHVVDFSTPRNHRVQGFDDFPIFCSSLAEPYDWCVQYLEHAGVLAGATVLDLGAYCGLTTIAFSKAVGATGRVVALERDSENHAAAVLNLERHAKHSGLTNVLITRACVAGTAKMVPFLSEGSRGSLARSVAVGERETGRPRPVQGITMLELATSLQLSRVDFVKMDIEGMEREVIATARAFLDQFRPRMIIEPHSVRGALTTDDVCGLLAGMRYTTEVIAQRGITVPLIVAVPTPEH